MRNPLNKAMDSENKGTNPGKDQIMNKDLQKIMDMAAEIMPPAQEDFAEGIRRSQAEQTRAIKAKETAKTETEFNKACDDAIRAREKEDFFRRKLEECMYTPRMDEAGYYGAVESAKAVMAEAAASFKATAEKAIAEIVQAREKYLRTIEDTDKALSALDAAANVLQSKYRYRVTERNNMPPIYTEDSGEWMRHSVRYGNGEGYNIVIRDPDNPEKNNDAVSAAWYAAERVKK